MDVDREQRADGTKVKVGSTFDMVVFQKKFGDNNTQTHCNEQAAISITSADSAYIYQGG